MKSDIDTKIENIACSAQGLASILGMLGAEALSYSQHIGNSAFLMQEVSQKIADDLYKVFEELRGG